MGVFLLLLVVVCALLVVFAVIVVKESHRVISQWIKNKKVAWLVSTIPLLLFIGGFFMNPTNAIVVDIYLFLIVLVTKFLFFLLSKIIKMKINANISLMVGIVLAVIVLTYAYYQAYHVRETKYTVYTTKNMGADNFRVVQVSDSHIGTTMDGKKFAEYMEKINELQPDIVVVTGDFVDDDTVYDDMVEAAKGLGKLQTKYGVFFVYGNHDKGYFQKRDFGDQELRRELMNNRVIILEDANVIITDKIALIGRQDAQVANRKNMQELMNHIDKNLYVIVLDHEPNDYAKESEAGVDLVLSGHTHGGQAFPIGELSVFIGANDSFYGKTQRDNTTFIVNAGISDWALKFKIGAVSEYGVIDIQQQ